MSPPEETSGDASNAFIATEPLVVGDYSKHHGSSDIVPVLCSDVPLSFWGGIDELTGIVIDASHPLCGKNVSDTILVLPSGRGSCTASQVLLELILNEKAPRALVLRDRDGLVCVGALVAQCCVLDADDDPNHNTGQRVFVPDIVRVVDTDSKTTTTTTTAFEALIREHPEYGSLLPDGRLVVGRTVAGVETKLESLPPPPESIGDANHRSESDGFGFDLTSEEQRLLEDSSTAAARRAVEVLIRYARIVMGSSPTYIDVKRAHIDGCTYIGPGGLRFVEGLVQDGGAVKIPTTLNSVSTDLRYWEPLGIEDDVDNRNSIRQANAYVALGCSPQSFTCAPYLLEEIPQQHDQIVWGESNAVVYANTVLGARTEKYADYLDICCAIAGKVPQIGVHLDEPRIPTLLLELDGDALDWNDDDDDDDDSYALLFPVLGHLCGTLSDGQVPLLVGLEAYSHKVTKDHLKAFCAAFGTTAASPLIHIAGITPEARDANLESWIEGTTGSKKITAERLQETFDLLDQHQDKSSSDRVDWVALGNPHLSLSEVDDLLRLVEHRVMLEGGSEKRDDVNLVACISRALYDKSPNVKQLEDYGVTFVRDTCWCMLLEPPMIPSDQNATILTNSGKYAHYGPGLTGRRFRLGSMKDCVHAAWTGSLPRRSFGAPLRTTGHPSATRTFSSRTVATECPHGSRGSSMGWMRNHCGLLRKALRQLR